MKSPVPEPVLRGLRSLPVRYELAATPEQPSAHAPDAEPAEAAETVLPDPAVRQRSSLWRYLTGLIGVGR